MTRRLTSRPTVCLVLALLVGNPAAASDLTYTFIDFQAISNGLDATGTQSPVAAQTVDIETDEGDGIAIAGSVAMGEHFFFDGAFLTSIVDVSGTITNPSVSTMVNDNFDLISSRIGFGYQREMRPNFDLYASVSYDSLEFDFGSFAGENFDMSDDGLGVRVGFRYNPKTELEVYGHAHFSSIGQGNLTPGTFDSDARLRVGLIWYFFEDLGMGFDYEAGEIDTFAISMRFSFGDLRLQ